MEQHLVNHWNRKFNPGRPVYLEACDFYSRTLCRAKIVDGIAMVHIADCLGPVPLRLLQVEPMESIDAI